MPIRKEESTRDIICIEFNYGSSSYEEAVAKIGGSEAPPELLDKLDKLKDKFDKKSKEELREIFYQNGVDIKYPTYNQAREFTGYKSVHYKMLYRTPGKAKKGSCMFVKASLYKKARNFLYMGIKLPRKNAPIVEIGAYSSLITSTIERRIHIDPDEILIIKDVDAKFMTNVISIETDERRQCKAVPRENYEVKNTLFDGQALIDLSIFPEDASGYVLLRHHFTKCAAFATRIQDYFKDYFGEGYEDVWLLDMFGKPHRAKDIKLITTENAIKWYKFDVGFDYWAEWVRANGSTWGVVKTAHESKLGEVQRMSYQMVNALKPEIMNEVMALSKDYVYRIKNNDDEFLDYLRKNQNFANDYEVLVALCENDPEFVRSAYFRDRKRFIISAYVKNLKNGRVVQNADNLVIVGSPYAMLLAAVGEDPLMDPTFVAENGCTQCWTGRFDIGEHLAAFRSPFNSQNNLDYLHNVTHPLLEKYFDFGRLIIAVNMIGTDWQDKNNGSDQDSDSVYCTNHPDIVEHAKNCIKEYPTIVNNIPKEKNHYSSSMKDFALVDNNLAHSQRAIGESSNLAQVCLSYGHTFDDPKYKDFACILAVLAQVAIDSAKRRFDIDVNAEIARIRQEMNVDENGYPAFWLGIRRDFNRDRINWNIRCPMNELYTEKFKSYQPVESTLPDSLFLYDYSKDLNKSVKLPKKVEKMISDFSLDLHNYIIKLLGYSTMLDNFNEHQEIFLLLQDNFDKIIDDLQEISFSKKGKPLMSWLINNALNTPKNAQKPSKLQKNRPILLKTLYLSNKKMFIDLFSKNRNISGEIKDELVARPDIIKE